MEAPTPPGLGRTEGGLLYCGSVVNQSLPNRWIVPASLRQRVCMLHHFARLSGHPGITRMTQTVSRSWYWPTLGKDCVATVRSCPNCAAQRLKRGPKRSTPLRIFPPDNPLEFLAMDVLGALPATARGNRFVLCITDRFTKMSVAIAVPDQTASTVAQAFVDRWICVFGMPFTILTDNGSAFTSKFFGVLTQVLGVKHVFTTAYRPTTNGQVERWNASLVDLVSHLGTEKEWDLHIGLACTAYNSTVQSSTGFAPLELATTREPCPAVWTRVPTLRPPGKITKSHLRHQLLLRAKKLC